MVGSFSNYTSLKILDHIVGKDAFTMVSPCWVSLLTTPPTDSTTPGGAGWIEPATANGYDRVLTVASDWAAATLNSATPPACFTTNESILYFPTATPGAWATTGYFALVDAASPDTGNMVGWGELTAPKTVLAGDSLSIPAGSLKVTLD